VTRGPHAAKSKSIFGALFKLLLQHKYKLATCLYFANLNFDSFVAVVLSATSPHLYRVLGDFHVSTDTLVQNIFLGF